MSKRDIAQRGSWFCAVTAVVTVLMLAARGWCHDYWLEPDAFFLAPNSATSIHMLVGEKLKKDTERPFQRDKTVRLELFGASGRTDLLATAREGQLPVARVVLGATGTYVVAIERAAQRIELDAEKFAGYLKEEGLEPILAERARAGESKKPARERYTRYLKLLLQVGEKRDETPGRPVGHRLEIQPLVNPYTLRAGAALRVRVLFDSAPLRGVPVFVQNRSQSGFRQQAATTSDDGTATFTIDRGGLWHIRLVHMRRAQDKTETDWESFWASCSFAAR